MSHPVGITTHYNVFQTIRDVTFKDKTSTGGWNTIVMSVFTFVLFSYSSDTVLTVPKIITRVCDTVISVLYFWLDKAVIQRVWHWSLYNLFWNVRFVRKALLWRQQWLGCLCYTFILVFIWQKKRRCYTAAGIRRNMFYLIRFNSDIHATTESPILLFNCSTEFVQT